MKLMERAKETAKVLGVSTREALILEFVSSAAWAAMQGKTREQEIMLAGAEHAAGIIDIETMRKKIKNIEEGVV